LRILTDELERLNGIIEKKNGEIRALGGEIQDHQEQLRLSALQANKLRGDLGELQNRLGSTNQ
jgi:predicted nuclease with TOPRIM domain